MSLRERKKLETRRAIIDAAWALFRSKGFDAATVEEIADSAGISRRTFFRYFPTKEAVVFHKSAERLEKLQALLEQSERGFDGVVRACLTMARGYVDDRAAVIEEYGLVQSPPALVMREYEIDREWVATIAEALAARRTKADLGRAKVLAGAIFGAMKATLAEWLDSGGELDLAQLGEQALSVFSRDLK